MPDRGREGEPFTHEPRTFWPDTEDGMTRLVALLPPEDGEVVKKALDAMRARPKPPDRFAHLFPL